MKNLLRVLILMSAASTSVAQTESQYECSGDGVDGGYEVVFSADFTRNTASLVSTKQIRIAGYDVQIDPQAYRCTVQSREPNILCTESSVNWRSRISFSLHNVNPGNYPFGYVDLPIDSRRDGLVPLRCRKLL